MRRSFQYSFWSAPFTTHVLVTSVSLLRGEAARPTEIKVKFNNNSGGVSGVPQMNVADFETSLPALLRTPAKLAAINEEAEEDDDIDQDKCGNIGEEVVVRTLDLQPNSLTQQLQSKCSRATSRRHSATGHTDNPTSI